MNFAGDSHDAYSVIIDSALGLLGAPPKDKEEFLGQVNWLQDYLSAQPAPKYPFAIDARRWPQPARPVFDATLRALPRQRTHRHAWCRSPKSAPTATASTPGTSAPPSRPTRWSSDMGIERDGLVEEPLRGYVAAFLDGIWLRAPYLHNGSVPTLRDLLEPARRTPRHLLARLRPLRPGTRRLRHRWRRSRALRQPARHPA